MLCPASGRCSSSARHHASRWHVPSRSSLRTILPPVSVAETAFGGGQSSAAAAHQQELAEAAAAECEIDSLKKLKLGLRSSLWSRPASQQASNPSSDYSIAV